MGWSAGWGWKGTWRGLCAMGLVAGWSWCALGSEPLTAGGPGRVGDVVFQAGFEGDDALEGWETGNAAEIAVVDEPAGSHSLRVEWPESRGAGYRSARVALPLEKLLGTRVAVEARVRAEAVAKPPQPWNGVKCMLHSVSPGGPRWQQQNSVYGTFDWKTVRFTAEVPPDAREAWLVLGLEQTTGTAWFDDVKISLVGRRRTPPAVRPAGPVYKGHNLARLRGAMISPRVTEDDLRVLGGQWKANHVRWQLIWGGFPTSPADRADLPAYRDWLESALQHLDRLLPVCRELGIHVAVDLHTPPGGRDGSSVCRIFQDRPCQEEFLAVWEKIARRYRDNPAVWGYDLVNEPVEGVVPAGLRDWHSLAEETARRVRRIDPQHAIIVEPSPWGGVEGLDWFEPLSVPGVVYSVHMYQPFQLTHQGVYNNPVGVGYPGEVGGQRWDRERLRLALKPAADFQRDYGVHIYLGEFSVIRWAPGDSGVNYLRDCIDLFEEHGWDWAYHAFREWDGWSLEHGPDRSDRTPSPAPTARLQLLQSWYGRNRSPGGPLSLGQ